jgi:hypothetical protein
MKAYKGFNRDMTCRGFQYKEGETYETDKAELCKSGFHACENPLDCFGYYVPGQSVYHEVELDAVDEKSSEDSKRVGTRIKIGAALDVAKICKLHFEFVKERTTTDEQGEDNANLSAQDGSSLAAQDRSSLAAQDRSSLAAQDGSSLAAGKNCVIAAFNSKAKAGMGSLIALATREWIRDECKITDCKAAVVDGVNLKPDVWYMLRDGEFVEVEDE